MPTELLEHPETADFLAFLSIKNVAKSTVEQYRRVLRGFFSALGPEVTAPSQVTAAMLRKYVAGIQARDLAEKTVNDRVLILKRLFGFLAAEGYVASDPAIRLPTPKVGQRLPKALSLDETRMLLEILEGDESLLGRRDRVLLNLLYGCGLRVSEAVGLRLANLDLAQGSLRVIGKGNKERRVYLKPALGELVRDYIAERKPGDYLFPGGEGGHLSARSVGYRVKYYAEKAGITRHVSPHTLRHSIAVHYLQGGAPVSFVQGLLGHASLATTGVYLLLTDQMTRDIALKTETAADKPAADPAWPKRVQELRPAYGADPWDGYVADCLEWLADQD